MDAVREPAAAAVGPWLVKVTGDIALRRGTLDAMLAPKQHGHGRHLGTPHAGDIRGVMGIVDQKVPVRPPVVLVELEHPACRSVVLAARFAFTANFGVRMRNGNPPDRAMARRGRTCCPESGSRMFSRIETAHFNKTC